MAATPNEPPGKRMAVRAEALGERIGRSLARARRRFETPRPAEPVEPPERPARDEQLMHRADDLVTRVERGVTSYATVLRNRVRRGVARIREEAEDIAAEAADLCERRSAPEPPADRPHRHEGEPAA